jgi:Uncharacterized protein conserved in bacteria
LTGCGVPRRGTSYTGGMSPLLDDDRVIADTGRWLERAVIGLNLCPFAKSVYVKDQVRYAVSHATTPEALREDLVRELQWLAAEDPQRTDTTLLIHPHVLQDFLDYNDFLDVADAVLDELDLEGVLQVASFHPHYQFAGTAEDDVENCTNRSPYPTLHLLREDSIERAVQAFPEPEAIYEANIRTLRALGREGFERLLNDDAAPGR